MLLLFKTFLAVVASILRSRAAVELENMALRHQISVLQRSAAKRPKLTSGDRLFWICLSRLWCDWRSTLGIVKPETRMVAPVARLASHPEIGRPIYCSCSAEIPVDLNSGRRQNAIGQEENDWPRIPQR